MLTVDAPTIIPADFPELKLLLWNGDPHRPIAAEDAFALYERYWRLVDEAHLTGKERLLINELAARFGGGHMLTT